MTPVVLLLTPSGYYDWYCHDCKEWYSFSRNLTATLLEGQDHAEKDEEAAAVAEAGRIIQEGARA